MPARRCALARKCPLGDPDHLKQPSATCTLALRHLYSGPPPLVQWLRHLPLVQRPPLSQWPPGPPPPPLEQWPPLSQWPPNTRNDSVRLLVLVGVTFPQDRVHSKKKTCMQNHAKTMQKPCHAKSCKIMSCNVMQNHAKSCKIMSCEQIQNHNEHAQNHAKSCHAKTMQNRAKQAKTAHTARKGGFCRAGAAGASMPGKWRARYRSRWGASHWANEVGRANFHSGLKACLARCLQCLLGTSSACSAHLVRCPLGTVPARHV